MVVKKKADKNWEYCVYIGKDNNGKKKYKRKCGFKTRKECIEEAKTFVKIDIKKSSRFCDVCQLFLEDCNGRELKISTLLSYKGIIVTINKNFPKARNDIKNITKNDIVDFLNDYTKYSSVGYKRKIVEVFKYIFKFAKNNKLIAHNIMDDMPLPKIIPTLKQIWSEKEIKEYLPILKNFKYYDIVYLTLETGLRKCEVVALTWDCVDLDRGVITIDKSYVTAKGYTYFSTPKTMAGVRTVALLQGSLEMLRKLYKKRRSKYVFPHPADINLPAHPHTVATHFTRFLKNNNLKPIRFHDLRHIHATLLINKNINYKVVSKRLGHTNIAFTLQVYTHILQDYEIQLFRDLSHIF